MYPSVRQISLACNLAILATFSSVWPSHSIVSVNCVIIGSGNGLLHVQGQIITWTSVGLISVRHSGTYFNERLKNNSRKCILNCCLHTVFHFVQVLIWSFSMGFPHHSPLLLMSSSNVSSSYMTPGIDPPPLNTKGNQQLTRNDPVPADWNPDWTRPGLTYDIWKMNTVYHWIRACMTYNIKWILAIIIDSLMLIWYCIVYI